jgi:hypothetical protein
MTIAAARYCRFLRHMQPGTDPAAPAQRPGSD